MYKCGKFGMNMGQDHWFEEGRICFKLRMTEVPSVMQRKFGDGFFLTSPVDGFKLWRHLMVVNSLCGSKGFLEMHSVVSWFLRIQMTEVGVGDV